MSSNIAFAYVKKYPLKEELFGAHKYLTNPFSITADWFLFAVTVLKNGKLYFLQKQPFLDLSLSHYSSTFQTRHLRIQNIFPVSAEIMLLYSADDSQSLFPEMVSSVRSIYESSILLRVAFCHLFRKLVAAWTKALIRDQPRVLLKSLFFSIIFLSEWDFRHKHLFCGTFLTAGWYNYVGPLILWIDSLHGHL